MDLSRRDVLAASAWILAGSRLAHAAPVDTGTAAPASGEPPPPTRVLSASSPRADEPVILCWNENPYGPSPAARAALADAVPHSCRYPDAEIQSLLEALARHEGLPVDHLTIGTGSGELLRALGWLCAREGGEIVLAAPTYLELPDYAHHTGAELKFVPVDAQLRHDLPAMRRAVSDRTRAVYLCNPNNPTGTALGTGPIRDFVASLPMGVLTIIDEAYLDFATAQDVGSCVPLIDAGHPVVVLRTFSKIHGMAGVRCGYAISMPQRIATLEAVRMTTPNIFAMRAARASLGDRAFLTDCRRRIVASRRRITDELLRLKLAYAEPQGNFVFFDTGAPLAEFDAFMKQRNVLVGRRFAPFDNWCRITIGTESEVELFLGGLRAFHEPRSRAL